MRRNKKNYPQVTVIGAGLSGIEATYQLIRRQVPVRLCEMRPNKTTGAHTTDLFSELVCSNSIGSNLPDRPSGLLKEEMRLLGSYFIDVAYKYRVPAGNALAVDRGALAREITRYIKGHSMLEFVNEEITTIPTDGPVIIATGPLTSDPLADELAKLLSFSQLYFFDAIAPILTFDSINMDIAFRSDRYGQPGKGDYINCPLDKEQYEKFIDALLKAEKIELSQLEKKAKEKYFCACQPIEIIAKSGIKTANFGPMKPVGLIDPKTGKRPYAVVQLRQDNLLASLYNIVGFQTNLKHSEQKRVFSMIPGLENAEFVRFGQMHRNTYINSPKVLKPTLQLKNHDNIFIAGQLTGVEGYCESVAMGLIAGQNCLRMLNGKELMTIPPETMIGALIRYITSEEHKKFNPMNANFGLFEDVKLKADRRKEAIIKNARKKFKEFFKELD